MCLTSKSSSSSSTTPYLLFSVDSFAQPTATKSEANAVKQSTAQLQPYSHPPLISCLLSGLVFCLFLLASEHFGRFLLARNQHWHVLLEQETNRQILARHFFVDCFSCTLCAYLGWQTRRESLYPVLRGTIPVAGYEQRLFTYSPAGFRLALVFFWYQVKNLVDTIVWDDGPEFIFHHVFSMITAWGSMTPGCGHLYGLFFFGMSEISTAVLCALANFDDRHGVHGLGQALPLTKVVLAAAFTALFILCRCILWPLTSYYFCRDILNALSGTDPRAVRRRHWMRFFLVSLSGLSVLQVLWLGQIYYLGKKELQAMGFL
jgi:TLC domain